MQQHMERLVATDVQGGLLGVLGLLSGTIRLQMSPRGGPGGGPGGGPESGLPGGGGPPGAGEDSNERRESRLWGEMMASLSYWASQAVQKDSRTPFWDQNSYYILRGLVMLHVHAAKDEDGGQLELRLPETPLQAKGSQGNRRPAAKWRRPVSSPEWVSWADAVHSAIQRFVRARGGLLAPIRVVVSRPPPTTRLGDDAHQPSALPAPAYVGRLLQEEVGGSAAGLRWISSSGLRTAATRLHRAPSLPAAEPWVSQALEAMDLSAPELLTLCECPLRDLCETEQLFTDGSTSPPLLQTDAVHDPGGSVCTELETMPREGGSAAAAAAEVPFVFPAQHQSAAARRLLQRTKHDIRTYLQGRGGSMAEAQLACVPHTVLRTLQQLPPPHRDAADGRSDDVDSAILLLEDACASLLSLQRQAGERASRDEEVVRLLSKLLTHSTAPTTRHPPTDAPPSALSAWWCWSLRRQSAQQAECRVADLLSLLVSSRPASVLEESAPPVAVAAACTPAVLQAATSLLLLYVARGRLLRQVAAHAQRLSVLLSSMAGALRGGRRSETVEGRPMRDVATEAEQLGQTIAAVLRTKRCWLLHAACEEEAAAKDDVEREPAAAAAAAAADGDVGSSSRRVTGGAELGLGVDATLLVFEYLTGFFLRPRQVDLVRELAAVGVNGGARVTQMLMGEGKTTVVAPLLALALADGQRIVAMCVPAPLIPQTRDVLSRTFGRSVWPRRVIEFDFDRLSVPVEGRSVQISHVRLRALGRLLRRGRLEGAVVLCTPTTLQSMQLKCIELMAASDRKVGIDAANAAIEARDADRGDKASEAAAASFNARQALRGAQEQMSAILRMWGRGQQGALILDEVDLVMHPLRSELNFPLGERRGLHLSTVRWTMAAELLKPFLDLDLGDCSSEGAAEVAVGGDAASAASSHRQHAAILAQLRKMRERGQIQTIPHVVLLHRAAYKQHLAPLLARLIMPWLRDQLQQVAAEVRELDLQGCACIADSTHLISSRVGADFSAARAVDGCEGTFWCCRSMAGQATWEVLLPREACVWEVQVTFKPLSEFTGYSGLSMVPDQMRLEIATEGEARAMDWTTVCVALPDAHTSMRVPLSFTGKRVRHVRLCMLGVSRWMAIQGVQVVELLDGCDAVANRERVVQLSDDDLLQALGCAAAPAHTATTQLREAIHEPPTPPPRMLSALPGRCIQLLNMCRDFLCVHLPWALGKVDRVSYGLLQPRDIALLAGTPQPLPRRLLAVPFRAKDSPSPSSEFAHPDATICLTLLAYQHEGLRLSDIESLVGAMQLQLRKEPGPLWRRAAFTTWQAWLEEARDRAAAASHQPAAHAAAAAREAESPPHSEAAAAAAAWQAPPLHLLQQDDQHDMQRLCQLLRTSGSMIRYYVLHLVLPRVMDHCSYKLSACGQELSSPELFHSRLGFSGTPGTTLPRQLGLSVWEAGSEGRMIHTLSLPSVVSSCAVPPGWDVPQLLQTVATHQPPLSALIDTGALITGLNNKEVALLLLRFLPSTIKGVVFLDEADRAVVLPRGASTRSQPTLLQMSGLDASERFTVMSGTHIYIHEIRRASHAGPTPL